MIWTSIAAISLMSSLYSLCLKKIQTKHIRNRFDFFVFIFYLNVFQTLFLFAFPPYNKLIFTKESLILGIVFGFAILIYYVFMMIALSSGPLVLTNSILALYLFIPIIFGLLFWNESLSYVVVIGLVLFLVSTLLITNTSYYDHEVEKKIELKWLIAVLIAFTCSGATSIISKQHAMLQPDFSKEYLLICRFTNIVLAGTYCLLLNNKQTRNNQTEMIKSHDNTQLDILHPDKSFIYLCVLAGFLMALANTLFMRVVTKYASAFFFPATQALGLIFMFFFSRFVFKEHLGKRAQMGYLMIAAAVMIISIG